MSQSSMAAADEKQYHHDRFYMTIAEAVRGRANIPGTDEDQPEARRGFGANCYGSKIGALLVLDDRVIGTGYNGTPTGFKNCMDDGCLRCKDGWLKKQGRDDEMSDPSHIAGVALDRCMCVHAEQNALLTAARFGIRVEDATMYTTLSPCFGCLKEAVAVGVRRVVYLQLYDAKYSVGLQQQYDLLSERLEDFGSLDPHPAETDQGAPDSYRDIID
jgi:dCMP deaminase